jgi:hypothetical protein
MRGLSLMSGGNHGPPGAHPGSARLAFASPTRQHHIAMTAPQPIDPVGIPVERAIILQDAAREGGND